MKRTARALAATVTGGLALGIGLGLAGLASAEPATPTSPIPSPSASAPATSGDKGRGGFDRGDGVGRIASRLAEKLDVDKARVQSALREHRKAHRATTRPAPGTGRLVRDDAALAKALAEKLNVAESDVTQALAEIRAERQTARDQRIEDRLAEAVTAGTLTQAEADAVKKAVDAGIVRVGRR
jgi:hypothetical protein